MKQTLKPVLLIALILGAAFCLYMEARSSNPPGSRPDWKKISPFTELEFEGDQIRVTYDGENRELISIEGLTTDELIAASKKQFGRLWEKRIREDIAEVLIAAGAEESEIVTLELKDPTSGLVTTIAEAPMTRENRQQLYVR